MSRGSAKAGRSAPTRTDETHGIAYRVGWYVFLGLVALTPLVIGALPPQFGPIATYRANDPVSLPKAVAFLALAGVSLSALGVGVARGEAELHWHRVLTILAGFVGWAAVSSAFSTSPALSIWGGYLRNEGLVAILGYWLVAFLAVQYVRSTRELRAVMVAAAAAGSLVALYTLAQFMRFDPIDWVESTNRVFSTFGNADMLGSYLVFPFALVLGLALTASDTKSKALSWAASALIVVALYISATRGAWLGALAMLLCVTLLGWEKVRAASRRAKVLAGGGAVALMLAVGAAITFNRVRYGGATTTLSSSLATLSNGRSVIWATGLRGWLAHPVTGWGPDAFGRAFDRAVGADWYALLASTGSSSLGSADNAHNIFVQALVTLGIPGVALMTWALLSAALSSLRSLGEVWAVRVCYSSPCGRR